MEFLSKNNLVRLSVFLFIFFQIFLTISFFKKNIPFEIQSLLHKDNPARINYELDLKNFSDETTNWIIFEGPSTFTDSDIFRLSSKVGTKLEMNYGVESIIGPHNAKYFKIDRDGFSLVPFIQNEHWSSDALTELGTDLWKNNLVRGDFKAFLISFRTSSQLDRKDEKKVFDQISHELKTLELQNPGLKTGLLGAKSASAHFLTEMQFQQRVLTPLLLLAIILFFFFCFRSVQIVLWSLFVMFICYTSTLCLIIFSEGGLGPYSSFALMFAFIVATSDLIQFFGRFQQLSGTVEERLKETLRIAWLPCLLTSLTTSIGFFALISNQNLPVRFFGLYCAFSCMLEWAIIFYVLPTILRAFNFKAPMSPYNADKFSNYLQNSLKKFSPVISFLTVAALVLGTYFTTQLYIDDNFYTKFEAKHPLSQTLDLFSNGFDFVGSINVVIQKKADSSSIYNSTLHSDFRKIENEILTNKKVSRISSISQVYENLNQKLKAASADSTIAASTNESLLHLMNNYGQLSDFFNRPQNEYRMTVYLRSLATQDLDSVLATVETISQKYQNDFVIRPTGFSVIRSYINSRVISDFFCSFFISFFLIFLCYYWLYRSTKWSLLALIPNAVPLLAVSGLMGLFKVPVDTNLVILICVAFGISGDNTIHLTYAIQQEQLKGLDYSAALKNAYRLVGIAIFATSLVFIACLPIFLLGNLRLFNYIAIFLSTAFFVALLADVFMFPHLQERFGWSLHRKDLRK